MSGISEMAGLFSVTEQEEKELLRRLGVESAKPEDIEKDVVENVLDHLIKLERDREEANNAKHGSEMGGVGRGNKPSSTSQTEIFNKLRAVKVEIDAVESTVLDVNNCSRTEERVNGSDDGEQCNFDPCRSDLNLRHALATDRLESLKKTKAQLEKQIRNLGKGASSKVAGIGEMAGLFSVTEKEEEELLRNLGVESAKPEDIEQDVVEKVLDHLIKLERNKEEANNAKHGSEMGGVGRGNEPSSTSETEIFNKLRAVKVEIDAVESAVEDVNNCSRTEERVHGSDDGEQCNFDPCRSDLNLRHALATDRLESLKKTRAQLEMQIRNLGKGSSSKGDGLRKEEPNHKRKQNDDPKNPKKRHKRVSFNDDNDDFDEVLNAASAGFVETERDELVRKGILTPFHKLKGFERRIQEPGPSVKVEESNVSDDHCSRKTKVTDPDSHQELDEQTHLQGPKTPSKSPRSRDKAGKATDSNTKQTSPSSEKSSSKRASRDEETEKDSSMEENNQESFEDMEENDFVTLEGGLKIPASIFSKLFDYQKVGVKWLWELHCQRAGGILGDEMGLGKTIQVLSFLGALHFSKMYRPSIVLCPVTLLHQWKREVEKWYPSFNVEILHDSAHSSLERDEAASFSLGNNKKWDSLINRVLRNGSGMLITTYEQLRILGEKLLDVEWGYAVLDEGHRIRNPNAEITLVCKQLQTVHRIIMTGAPIQNRLSELWSLFDFVFPGKLGVLPVFEAEFAVPISLGGYANASPLQVATAYRCAVILRDLIMPYLLRRMKADVNTRLPKKTEHVLFCSLTPDQRSLYRAFLASPEVEKLFNGDMRNSSNGSGGSGGSGGMGDFGSHPDLPETEDETLNPGYGNPERSCKMIEHGQGHNSPQIQQSLHQPFVASTKGEQVSNADANALYGNHVPRKTYSHDDLRERERAPRNDSCGNPKLDSRTDEEDDCMFNSAHTQRSSCQTSPAGSRGEQRDRSFLYGIDVMRKICNHPDLLKREYAAQNPDYGNPERSGKMKVVGQVLKMWKEQGHRVLLFSQTQQMLDILEKFLIADGYSYRRMDGSTPVKRRMALMDEFNNSPDIFIFVLTTKVGGLGTNLTGANRVIIYDPDWNPSIDMQARERAWRIGQTKDVTVYRLITRGTIEEKVYHRQIYKHFLTNKVLKNPQQRRFFKRRDMRDLFTLNDDGENGSTETSNLFSQLPDDINIPATHANNQDSPSSATRKMSETETFEKEKPGDGSREGREETSILRNLFDAGIHSAVNHDVIVNAHDEEKEKLEEQASQVAERAAEALRQSRMVRSQESIAVPTWTGKSGAAGAPGPLDFRSNVILDGKRPEVLIREIVTFIQKRGGSSDSVGIVQHFKDRIPSKDLYLFKSLLKQIATLQKSQNGSSWILKPEYQ